MVTGTKLSLAPGQDLRFGENIQRQFGLTGKDVVAAEPELGVNAMT